MTHLLVRLPVAVLRRLPGAARPRAEALREYEEFNARRRKRIAAVLWQFWAPDPDQFYRWRVQLWTAAASARS